MSSSEVAKMSSSEIAILASFMNAIGPTSMAELIVAVCMKAQPEILPLLGEKLVELSLGVLQTRPRVTVGTLVRVAAKLPGVTLIKLLHGWVKNTWRGWLLMFVKVITALLSVARVSEATIEVVLRSSETDTKCVNHAGIESSSVGKQAQ